MNDIINISNRLKCVASLVNKGARVADIGTDHAYLPIYLVQNGISNKVYACDVRKEPLRRAQLHIDEYGLSDKITTQLCDGLKGINKGDVDTVTICGMGGKLMKSILQAGIDKLGYNTQLVLSAQSELRDFRAYLLEAGIDIKSEHILLEDGKYYFTFSSVLISSPSSASCLSSAILGASVIRQEASFTFGNAITSRMLSTLAISITRRSSPYARPACGGTPYLNAFKRNSNCSYACSFVNLRTSKILS